MDKPEDFTAEQVTGKSKAVTFIGFQKPTWQNLDQQTKDYFVTTWDFSPEVFESLVDSADRTAIEFFDTGSRGARDVVWDNNNVEAAVDEWRSALKLIQGLRRKELKEFAFLFRDFFPPPANSANAVFAAKAQIKRAIELADQVKVPAKRARPKAGLGRDRTAAEALLQAWKDITGREVSLGKRPPATMRFYEEVLPLLTVTPSVRRFRKAGGLQDVENGSTLSNSVIRCMKAALQGI